MSKICNINLFALDLDVGIKTLIWSRFPARQPSYCLIALTEIKQVVANLAVLSLGCPLNDSRNAIVSMHKVRRNRDYINVTIQIDRVCLVIAAIAKKKKEKFHVISTWLME